MAFEFISQGGVKYRRWNHYLPVVVILAVDVAFAGVTAQFRF